MTPQREWLDKDYYKVLGVSSDASAKEITQAYRKLARKFHPDAEGGDETKFKEVSAAYDVLGDADKRREYDEVRRLGPMAGGFAGAPGGGDGAFRINVEDLSDVGGLGDLLGGLFGRGAGTRTGGVRPIPGADVETALSIGFDDAVHGVTTDVHVEGRTVKVRIPQGVGNGQRIRLRGKGREGRNGGPPGDLFVVVQVAPHEVFGRERNDLTLTLPITFAEAVLGANVRVPTLDDDSVTLKIPAGTRSGRTFRVRDRGIRTGKGVGDLLVTVEVAVPTEVTEPQREAIETLEKTLGQRPRSHLEDWISGRGRA